MTYIHSESDLAILRSTFTSTAQHSVDVLVDSFDPSMARALPRPDVTASNASDAGRIKFGAGLRLPRPNATAPGTADAGRIKFGAGLRLPRPNAAPANVSDPGRIKFGAGLRLPAGK